MSKGEVFGGLLLLAAFLLFTGQIQGCIKREQDFCQKILSDPNVPESAKIQLVGGRCRTSP